MSEHERCSVGHLDPHSPEFVADRDALFARLRAQLPVAHSTAYGGFWLTTRYDDVRRVLEDPVSFSSAFPGRVAVPPTATSRSQLAPLEFDPPRHTAQIALLATWFGSGAVEPLRPAVSAHVRSLLTPADRSLEVVHDLAQPLTSMALTQHLRLPASDADRWVRWADALFAHRVAQPQLAEQAAAELREYVAGILADRRQRPRDDPWTLLASAPVDGGPLPEDEAVGYGTMLLLAGRDATVDAIANVLVHLATHPDDQQRLRSDSTVLPRAAEELLRVYTPIGHLARVTTCPVELAGVRVPAGETVAVAYGSANRDERVFPDAERVDLDRRRNAHLAFGAGVHRCLGAQLARLVLITALREVLAILPRFALDDAKPLELKPNGDTRGYLAAHLTW